MVRTLSTPVNIPLPVRRAMALGKPVVMRILSPAPVMNRNLAGFGEAPPAPDAWDATNKAIQSLSTVVGTGTKFYSERQDTKLLQSQADAADRAAAAAKRKADLERQAALEAQNQAMIAAASAPKNTWVLPAAIGGVVLAGIAAYFLLRKKAT